MLRKRGFTPKLQRLDNEASKILQYFMKEQGVDFQITPAGLHRRNSAEQAIQTVKNHFILGVISTSSYFPLNLLEKLLLQVLLTLNLIRPARVNLQLSVYAHVHGAFNYSKTPIALPGISCLAHEPLELRKS